MAKCRAIAWIYLSPLIPAVLLLASNPAVYDLVGAAANYTYDTGQYADFYNWASDTLQAAADDAANWRDKAKAGIQGLADDVADAANQATVWQNTMAFVDALTDAASDTWDKGKDKDKDKEDNDYDSEVYYHYTDEAGFLEISCKHPLN